MIYRVTVKTTGSVQPGSGATFWNREVTYCGTALECDYDRLAELRDERDDWEPPTAEEIEERIANGGIKLPSSWADLDPDAAEELKELEAAANPCGNPCADREDAERMIHDDPLS